MYKNKKMRVKIKPIQPQVLINLLNLLKIMNKIYLMILNFKKISKFKSKIQKL